MPVSSTIPKYRYGSCCSTRGRCVSCKFNCVYVCTRSTPVSPSNECTILFTGSENDRGHRTQTSRTSVRRCGKTSTTVGRRRTCGFDRCPQPIRRLRMTSILVLLKIRIPTDDRQDLSTVVSTSFHPSKIPK